ncbi:MAG: endonuclease/exonuclease/phosphatase family protein [Cyanobacteria bacterium P01_F01_bin.13]
MGITSLALLSQRFGWPLYLEIFSHFQVQYFIATLLLAGLTLLLHHFRSLLLVLFCGAVLSAQVIPWYVPSTVNKPAANLRVLLANLNANNSDATQTLALMDTEQPDLALFIEVGEPMGKRLKQLKKSFPYGTDLAADSGIVLYSKYPLTDVQTQPFGLHTRDSLLAHLEINGQPLSFIASHPLPPTAHELFQSRNTVLADVAQYANTQTDPIVLLGDLNVTMWSPYYQDLIHKTGLKNSRQGFGIQPSWPTNTYHYGLQNVPQTLLRPLQIPIDHCLVSPEITVTGIHTGAETGSDHLPVIADLWIDANSLARSQI